MVPELAKIIQADAEAGAAVEQAQAEAQVWLNRAFEQVRAIQTGQAEEVAHLEQKVRAHTVAGAEAQAQEILAATQRYLEGLQDKAAARREEALTWLCREVLL
jgi:vacuolar-type H+-ATPase subunit H